MLDPVKRRLSQRRYRRSSKGLATKRAQDARYRETHRQILAVRHRIYMRRWRALNPDYYSPLPELPSSIWLRMLAFAG
jgi:hypothetical protein